MISVSIVGDSISTFEGYTPPGYAVFYNEEMQSYNGITSVYDIWWAKVNQAMQAYLCVNNSYSGSRVAGLNFPSAASNERLSNLRTTNDSPDIILIYIGFNDFGNGVAITKNKEETSSGLLTFEDFYEFMIEQIKMRYPCAKVVCGTLIRSKIRANEHWGFPEKYAGIEFEEYNNAIRRIAKRKDVFLADIGSRNIRYETLDGVHPTKEGHQTIADAWIASIVELNLLEPSIESCVKFYNCNKDNDIATNMVFRALSKEKVLMPFSKNGNLLTLPLKESTIIPVFTSPKEVNNSENVILKPVFLRENIDKLLDSGRNIAVNPFSDANLQFVVPFDAIQKMLIPLIDID